MLSICKPSSRTVFQRKMSASKAPSSAIVAKASGGAEPSSMGAPDPHSLSPQAKPEFGVPPVGTQQGKYHSSFVIGENNATHVTDINGAPVSNNRHSLTLGPAGPLLAEDTHLLNKLQSLNREKIPERVVHARGTVGKGTFTVEEDMSDLTFAQVLQKGTKTDVAVRFSPVTHPNGAPELLRDIRGFATKFYTDSGNWDLVGNSTPTFFLRDAINFPDLVHAFSPNPQNNVQEFWRIFDFLQFFPESMLTQTYLFGDEGLPASYRHMDGHSINTFILVNSKGEERLCRFYWHTQQGFRWLDDDEASYIAGKNHSHFSEDLFANIERGNYPKWTLLVQTMTHEEAAALPFEATDTTKLWPEDQFPLRPVGTMVLDKNVDNFFNENEQIAFSPGNLVPGILPSNDKLLQARLIAYQDAQRYRLGANFATLPINAPKCPFHNMMFQNGQGNFMHRTGDVNYYPSQHVPVEDYTGNPHPLAAETVTGQRVKADVPKTTLEQDLKQVTDRINCMDDGAIARMVRRMAIKLSDPKIPQSQLTSIINMWRRAHEDFGDRLDHATKSMIEKQKTKNQEYSKLEPRM